MLYIIGFGPGDQKRMTAEAAEALGRAEVIVGYSAYTALLKEYYPEKTYIETGMRGEMERCKKAVETALSGKETAVVCSGDAGIYGMAGLVLETMEQMQAVERLNVHVVAGVTAAMAGAALLGAPLGHDLAIISLSDLMTPWEVIEKRLAAAAEADFCIALYNPSSRSRKERFVRACEILRMYLDQETPCGLAHNIGRAGEVSEIVALKELPAAEVDMQTVVLIGNSSTRRIGAWMVTPRGYLEKYG
ncbi:MAG: precorrin-3B C(17)-methyltransferase [Lachnospiraceae bacterium]|nr:precorrin-3B C(17)-methyltransferase [Lachnospiraceae bacterium]